MRRRVFAAIVAVAAGAVLLFAVPLSVVLPGIYRDEELLRLQRDTVAATRGIDLTGAARGRDAIELPAGSDVHTAYDRGGRLAAGRGRPLGADAVTLRALHSGRIAVRGGGGPLVVVVPLLSAERTSGALRAQRSDATVARRTRDAQIVIAAVAIVLITLAAAAAALLGRRLARPLERLAGAASRLGEGDFTVRSPTSGVAEVDAVAAALHTTAQRLEAMLTRERAFSANASHQLRTPLAALRLSLESLARRGVKAPEIEEAITEVDRLERTIQTLLDVARDTPRPTTCDLSSALEELDTRWRAPLVAVARPLRVDAGAGQPMARASPGVVGEVLDVLLDNALRHGGGTVSVTVRDASGSLAVDVTDEGDGFADVDGALIPGRGPRGPGHGMGLALAASLAGADGGRLTVAAPGPRPTVTLLLRRDK